MENTRKGSVAPSKATHIILTVFWLCFTGFANVEATLPRFPESHSEHNMEVPHNDRIVGGEPAEKCQFPHQISLQREHSYGTSHFCGGSLINNEWAITAAHCLARVSANKLVVYAGIQKLSEKETTGQKIGVKRKFIHSDYDSSDVTNDIGLLKLDGSVRTDSCLSPIALPTAFEDTDAGVRCITSGWGTVKEGGSLPDELRYVDVPVTTQSYCAESYGEDSIFPSMICAGLKEGGKDSCQGDSGGPLVCNNKLSGIVSWGYGCARPEYPGVYTKVSHFVEWIESTMAAVEAEIAASKANVE